MQPREKVISALNLKQPKGLVPTFELEFQLSKELLGQEYNKDTYFVTNPIKVWEKATEKEKERMVKENAELYVKVAEKLNYSGIMEVYAPNTDLRIKTIKEIRRVSGNKYFLFAHGDATYSIPFSNAEQFCYSFFDMPDQMKENAQKMVENALEDGKKLIDNGLDGFALCSDYCDTKGPFLSPKMFDEFILPYYQKLVKGYKDIGAFVIKHTDGNIMPVIDRLVEAGPHALHSLDPSAGVDIREIREKYGNKVCLIGNLDCHLLHRGTKKEVAKAAKGTLKKGMPKEGNGGFIFATSNVVFRGQTQEETDKIFENYMEMLKVWKKEGKCK